jgi:hypothetical protein
MANTDVYHVQLRQFPHNLCRFNLGEQELRGMILEDWAQQRWIELGERKWNPQQAKLTILEGSRLRVDQLSMGRGWRAAERNGRDVTEQLLAATRVSLQPAPGRSVSATPPPAPPEDLLADSFGLALLSKLGTGGMRLHAVWELARERYPERSAGQCLVLAEQVVASLRRARLITVSLDGASASPASDASAAAGLLAAYGVSSDRNSSDMSGGGSSGGETQIDAALRAIDNWCDSSTRLRIDRA